MTTSGLAALILVTSVVTSAVRRLYGTRSTSSMPTFLACFSTWPATVVPKSPSSCIIASVLTVVPLVLASSARWSRLFVVITRAFGWTRNVYSKPRSVMLSATATVMTKGVFSFSASCEMLYATGLW